ncbi:MAG: hypothetical protein JW932_12290 [Deltaproteobacteria bacterium]|nr:hypothetical protein [Deltaproteobacteria bacterium]
MVFKENVLKPIRVETYSGYKADERPLYLVLDERRMEVLDIIDRWYGEEADYFKVRVAGDRVYLILRDRRSSRWILEKIIH